MLTLTITSSQFWSAGGMLAAYILLNERRWWTISTFIKTNTQRRHTDEETGEDVTIISLHKELKKLSEQLGK